MDDEISGFFRALGAPEVFVGFKGKWRSGGDEGGFEGINGKRHWGVQAKMEDSIIAFHTSLLEGLEDFFFFFKLFFQINYNFPK